MILRSLFLPAVLTGPFRAAFAAAFDFSTDMLETRSGIGLACVSGFTGNVFAPLAPGQGRAQ